MLGFGGATSTEAEEPRPDTLSAMRMNRRFDIIIVEKTFCVRLRIQLQAAKRYHAFDNSFSLTT